MYQFADNFLHDQETFVGTVFLAPMLVSAVIIGVGLVSLWFRGDL